VINSPQTVWKCSSLSINTRVHLYQALVMSVMLYGAKTWTLLVADMKTLDAFHMRRQQQILHIRWWSQDSNADIWLVNNVSSTLISVWPCCTPGPRSTSPRCSAPDDGYYEDEKPRPAGEDRRAAVATSGSILSRMPVLYRCPRCGDLRSPGVTERNSLLGLRNDRTTTTSTMMMVFQCLIQ